MSAVRIAAESARDLVLRAAASSEPALSLRAHLQVSFLTAGFSRMEAEEAAELWRTRFDEELARQLDRWTHRRIPVPGVLSANGQMLLTPANPRYSEIAPSGGLSGEHWRWEELLRNAGPEGLKLLGTAWLVGLGCRPVLVVDGPGDCGVDALGLLDPRLAGPHLVTLQAKSTGAAALPLPTVREDVLKYRREFATSDLSARVLQRLFGSSPSAAGVTDSYVVWTGAALTDQVLPFAQQHRVLVRDRAQAAWALSRRFALHDVQQLLADHPTVPRSLDVDWSMRIAPLLS